MNEPNDQSTGPACSTWWLVALGAGATFWLVLLKLLRVV
jgi:hypothetical protein